MNATDILRHEHEAILRMLGATEETANQLERGVTVKPETLAGLLEFFRVFADRCHHGKEEEHLFPALEQRGLPRDGGPVGVMLHEHEQGRAFIRQMAEATDAYAAGNTVAGSRWVSAARGYADLLRAHIAKENDILFVMAERILTGSELEEMASAFEVVEKERIGEGTHERLHASMDVLCKEIFGEAGPHSHRG